MRNVLSEEFPLKVFEKSFTNEMLLLKLCFSFVVLKELVTLTTTSQLAGLF